MPATVFTICRSIFKFPHVQARWLYDDSVLCEVRTLDGSPAIQHFIWGKNDTYGIAVEFRCMQNEVYTARSPHARIYKSFGESLLRYQELLFPVPMQGLCFGFVERNKVTGFLYYALQGTAVSSTFHWFVTPGSRLLDALPRNGFNFPNLRDFWRLFEAGKLIDITEEVSGAHCIANGKQGTVYAVRDNFYAHSSSPEAVRADPKTWFNGRVGKQQEVDLSKVLAMRSPS